jgi:hypothetical protein
LSLALSNPERNSKSSLPQNKFRISGAFLNLKR